MFQRIFKMTSVLALTLVVLALFIAPKPADAQVTAFKQAVAEAAARDKDIAAFYQANGYKSVWTGRSGRERSRRQALIKALANASRSAGFGNRLRVRRNNVSTSDSGDSATIASSARAL